MCESGTKDIIYKNYKKKGLIIMVENLTMEKAMEMVSKYDNFVESIFESIDEQKEMELVNELSSLYDGYDSEYDLFENINFLSAETEELPFEDFLTYYFYKESVQFLTGVFGEEKVSEYANFGELSRLLAFMPAAEIVASA